MKRDEIQVIFQNEIDYARLYWVQVSWWQWVPQGLCEERPELSHASLIWLQWPHRQQNVAPLGKKKNREQDSAEETPRSEEEEEEVLHGGQHFHVAAHGEPRLEQVWPAGLLTAGRTHTRSRGKVSGERSGREELTWADHSPIPHALGPLRGEGSRRLGSEVESRKRGWVAEKCCFIVYLCFILPNPLIKYLF